MIHEPVEKRDLVVFIRTPFCAKEHKADIYQAIHGTKTARDQYMDALDREIKAAGELFEGRRVRAIYVGGGAAPVAAPEKLARTIIEFKRSVERVRGCEVTMRFSPKTVSSPSLTTLNSCSFNRVTLEVLSARNEVLENIGAPHLNRDIAEAVGFLGVFGAANIDCEMLYGIPGQTPTTLRNDAVICTGGRGMTHVTLRAYRGEGCEDVSDDQRREQFYAAHDYLEQEGHHMYTSECFARDRFVGEFANCEAHGIDRVGFGLGAQSFVDGMSWRNTHDFDEYVTHSDDFENVVRDIVQWDAGALARRDVSLGLARRDGFDPNELAEKAPEIAEGLKRLTENLCAEGLATIEGCLVVPTVEGLRRAPEIQKRAWDL